MNIGYAAIGGSIAQAAVQPEGALDSQARRLLSLAEELSVVTAVCEQHARRLGYRPSDERETKSSVPAPEPSSDTVTGRIEVSICRISDLTERVRLLGNDLEQMI